MANSIIEFKTSIEDGTVQTLLNVSEVPLFYLERDIVTTRDRSVKHTTWQISFLLRDNTWLDTHKTEDTMTLLQRYLSCAIGPHFVWREVHEEVKKEADRTRLSFFYGARVPVTKEYIRALSLSHIQCLLYKEGVCTVNLACGKEFGIESANDHQRLLDIVRGKPNDWKDTLHHYLREESNGK